MRKACFIISVLISIIFFISPIHAKNFEDNQVIKVGLLRYLDQDEYAVQMMRGYLTDYLNEISKQYRWHYEYYTVSVNTGCEKLLNGELDILAPVQNSRAYGDKFAFIPGFSGCSLLNIYGRRSDPKMSVENAETMNGKYIGIVENEANRKFLKNFLNMNDLNMAIKSYPTYKGLLNALHSGEIQAVADDGTHITTSERRLISFATVSTQLMIAADNLELNDKLTAAIQTIEFLNPTFETFLKAEFIDPVAKHILNYTNSEKAFIATSPTIRAVFLPTVPALYSAESNQGIYNDFLKTVTEEIGLHFEMVQAKNLEELQKMLQEGQADISFAVYGNDNLSNILSFCGDFHKEKFSAVVLSDHQEIKHTIAIPTIFLGLKEYFYRKYSGMILSYDSVQKCLDAVKKGDCDIAYIPESYLRRENILAMNQNLTTDEEKNIFVPISVAIYPKHSYIFQKVISKSLQKMGLDKIEKIISKNSAPNFSIGYLLARYPFTVAATLFAFLVGGGLILFTNFRNKMIQQKNKELSEKNRELTEALQARDIYKSESETDKLTGLYNKATMIKKCREKLQNLEDKKLAAIFVVDLDKFKQANDTYGHQYGDKILQNFALKLKGIFRATDLIGRFGGDEFIVFVGNLPDQKIIERKAKQISRTAHEILVDEKFAAVSASIGVAISPRDGNDYEELFKIADQMLYQVKMNGRDGYCINSGDVIHHNEEVTNNKNN